MNVRVRVTHLLGTAQVPFEDTISLSSTMFGCFRNLRIFISRIEVTGNWAQSHRMPSIHQLIKASPSHPHPVLLDVWSQLLQRDNVLCNLVLALEHLTARMQLEHAS